MAMETIYKPKDEIDELLKDVESIFVIRCGWCTAACASESSGSWKLLKEYLNDKEIRITGSCVVLAVCIGPILKERLTQFKRKIDEAEAIGIVSCAEGMKCVYLENKGNKRIVPLVDTVAITSPYLDWPVSELTAPCNNIKNRPFMCEACVLNITNGICTLGNCTLRLRTPCRKEDEIVKECKEDKSKECPFFRIKQEGNLNKLMAFEEKLKDKSKIRVPMFKPELEIKPAKGITKKILSYTFARISWIFARLITLASH